MKLKLDDKGNVVVQDGKPVYVHDDGKEIPFDAPHALATISRVNGEAKNHREAKEAAEAKLKTFEGIEDPEAAKAALETVSNLDQGKLIQAGKVEEIKAAAKKAAEEQVAAANKAAQTKIDELTKTNETLQGTLNDNLIGGGFRASKLLTDPKHPKALAIPADMAQAQFGRNFKVEDGKVVGYDNSGNKIYSRSKAGEVADMDEALEMLVDAYPHKDQILRGTGSRGDGAKNSNVGGQQGAKTIARAEFDKLSPVERQNKVMVEKVQVVD